MKYGIHSLAFKQSMLILIGITFVFGMMFGSYRISIDNQMKAILMKRGTEISEKNLTYIDKIFTDCELVAENATNVLAGKGISDGEHFPEALKSLLEYAREKVPQVIAVVLATDPENVGEYMKLARYEDGRINVITGSNYSDKEWFVSTKKAEQPLWQEPFVGDFVDEPIAVFTIPFYLPEKDGVKKIGGVICIDISLEFLRETVDQIKVINSGYSFVLSEKNTVVAHPNEEWVFNKTLSDLTTDDNESMKKLGHDIKQKMTGLLMGKKADGTAACIYHTPMHVKGWTFGVVWPAQKFFEEQHAMKLFFIKLTVAGYLIMLFIVLFISFRVARPLNKMSRVAHDLGKGNFDVKIPRIRGKDEVAQFAQAFNRMRESLVEYIENLKNVTDKNLRMESELNVARDIQLGVLPKNEDEESMRDGRHELSALLEPARGVGGDFYDFFPLDKDHIVLLIADVSGKGVPAALFMMSVRTQLKSLALASHPVDYVFDKANERLTHKNDSNMFVTVWMGVLDLQTGHVEFCCAGHNPPVIRHENGETEFIQSKSGLVMGGMPGIKYKMQSVDLQPGDTIFLYTDGVTESCNVDEKFFGDARLLESLRKSAGEPTKNLCTFVKSRIDGFVGEAPQFDDITMLALKYVGQKEEKKSNMQNFRKEMTVDSKIENIETLTSFVESSLSQFEPTMKAQMQINVAIDELFSNVIHYSGSSKMTLVLEVNQDVLTASLTFIDEGVAYDPLKKDDPDTTLSAEQREVGGLGIFLVKKTMDDVEYKRDGNKNVLKIVKKLV